MLTNFTPLLLNSWADVTSRMNPYKVHTLCVWNLLYQVNDLLKITKIINIKLKIKIY